jgi:uncharacterized protein YrzB (UPF0473 family)
MAEEKEDAIITLLDEEGKEHQFEHLASLEHEDSTYVALVPANEDAEQLLDSDGELVILKVVYDEESGEDVLEAIEDDDEFNAVSAKFEEMLEDEYDILDDEDTLSEEDSLDGEELGDEENS